jgi:hypothetical protein
MRIVVVVVTLLLVACESPPTALAAPGPGAADITILTQPAGAAVIVDGQARGAAPVTLKLNPGPHRLRASLSGYYPAPETKIVVERATAATHTLPLVASH